MFWRRNASGTNKIAQAQSESREGHADCTKDGLALPVMLFVNPLFGKIIYEIFNIISQFKGKCKMYDSRGIIKGTFPRRMASLRPPIRGEIRDRLSVVICDILNVVVRILIRI